jgi:hypothetical protein
MRATLSRALAAVDANGLAIYERGRLRAGEPVQELGCLAERLVPLAGRHGRNLRFDASLVERSEDERSVELGDGLVGDDRYACFADELKQPLDRFSGDRVTTIGYESRRCERPKTALCRSGSSIASTVRT